MRVQMNWLCVIILAIPVMYIFKGFQKGMVKWQFPISVGIYNLGGLPYSQSPYRKSAETGNKNLWKSSREMWKLSYRCNGNTERWEINEEQQKEVFKTSFAREYNRCSFRKVQRMDMEVS